MEQGVVTPDMGRIRVFNMIIHSINRRNQQSLSRKKFATFSHPLDTRDQVFSQNNQLLFAAAFT